MIQTDVYDYFRFGFNYNILLETIDDDHTIEEFMKKIKEYIDFINELNLKVTKEGLKSLDMNEDIEKLRQLYKEDKKAILQKKLQKKFIQDIKKADFTLDSELKTKDTFVLQEKRYSTEILMKKIGNLFAENVFDQLPSIAQIDFEESGKCIAFERNTASAFHSLRGTEDVIKFYYEKLFNIPATDRDTWYSFVDKIKTESINGNLTPKSPEELLVNLDLMRKFYRNKTQHPQLIYDSDEAQDLLSHCIRSVNQIIKDLILRKLI